MRGFGIALEAEEPFFGARVTGASREFFGDVAFIEEEPLEINGEANIGLAVLSFGRGAQGDVLLFEGAPASCLAFFTGGAGLLCSLQVRGIVSSTSETSGVPASLSMLALTPASGPL